jgi:hypothetical protein
MIYPQSPEYQLEQAIVPLFSSVTGLNVYTTNRIGSKLFPYVSISAKPVRQLVNLYSGVYEMRVDVTYSNTSAKYTSSQVDEQYLQIFEDLYYPVPELNNKIQQNAVDLLVYMARISSQTPSILVNKRAWVRGLVITAIVTPDPNIDGSRAYIFSDELNSFYLATI